MLDRRSFLALAAGLPLWPDGKDAGSRVIPAPVLEDRIRGGLLGQIIGDLNGLKHEMKYILKPGDVREYTPALPDGAWTDDDTDVEWPYLLEMQRSGNLMLPPGRIAELWKRHINRRIWCSHLYARQLMDIGIEPPWTGRAELNPWADFNLSGQFVSESWGLISPGMPRTAAEIGIHYTHVSVDGEPVQATQMMDAMIATAFLTDDMDRILDAGTSALDPASTMRGVLRDVRRWHRENPADWRATRRLTKEKYCLYGGHDMRDRNGVVLNGASTVAALLYGGGDFVRTLRAAFNFGWDADNNAAACGTILGVIKGYRWMAAQHWDIRDRFRNTSRDNMPDDETITSFGDRLIALARRNVERSGGSAARDAYRIPVERPANVERLPAPGERHAELRKHWSQPIETVLSHGGTEVETARAAYLAICLDLAPALAAQYPQSWRRAVSALSGYPNVLQVLFFESPIPAGAALRAKAVAAGLPKPARSIKIWQ